MIGSRQTTQTFALAVLTLAIGCRSAGPVTQMPRRPACAPCSRILPAASQATCAAVRAVPPAEGEAAFENLVFMSGGVKGVAYSGALGAFGDERLAGVERVAGSSVGAIMAMIVSLGFGTEEACALAFGLDFGELEDGGSVRRFFKHFGWYKGDTALCLLECLVEKGTGSRRTTFAELHELAREDPRFKDLYVFGTDVNNQLSVELSHRNPRTRDMPIAEATRISMSIPFVFAARRHAGDVFVDGAVLRDYPIRTFDDGEINPSTLGFYLTPDRSRRPIRGFKDFGTLIFEMLINVQTRFLCETPVDVERTVFINTLGVGATDFRLTPEKRLALFGEGYEATEKYLTAQVHASTCPTFPSPEDQ